MTCFTVHMMGQSVPITVDLDYHNVDELADVVGQSRFLLGHMTQADEDGVCRRVMIATSRIQCAVEH